MSRLMIVLLVLLSLTSAVPGQTSAQIAHDTGAWCDDGTTVCWTRNDSWWPAGVRFVFEPQLGVLFQTGDDKFDNTNLESLEKVGVATDLYGKHLGLQFLLVYPSSISFDEQSDVRKNGRLVDDTEFKVDVEWGWTFGAIFLDGVLSVGYGQLHYDERDFVNPEALDRSTFRDGFVYVNFQAIEAVKSAIKNF